MAELLKVRLLKAVVALWRCACRSGAGLLAAWLAASGHAYAAEDLAPWRGGPAPVLELTGMDDKAFDLRSLRGKTVVVNFWATWCAPCVEEMPSMQKLKAQLDPAKFEVLAVNIGESKTRIEGFLKKVPVAFPIVLDPQSETSRAWQVRGVPTTFVIGPDGTIRYYHVGDLDWSERNIVKRIQEIK